MSWSDAIGGFFIGASVLFVWYGERIDKIKEEIERKWQSVFDNEIAKKNREYEIYKVKFNEDNHQMWENKYNNQIQLLKTENGGLKVKISQLEKEKLESEKSLRDHIGVLESQIDTNKEKFVAEKKMNEKTIIELQDELQRAKDELAGQQQSILSKIETVESIPPSTVSSTVSTNILRPNELKPLTEDTDNELKVIAKYELKPLTHDTDNVVKPSHSHSILGSNVNQSTVLTPNQKKVVDHLKKNPGQTNKEISVGTGIVKNNLSAVLKSLTEKHIISKDENDNTYYLES